MERFTTLTTTRTYKLKGTQLTYTRNQYFVIDHSYKYKTRKGDEVITRARAEFSSQESINEVCLHFNDGRYTPSIYNWSRF